VGEPNVIGDGYMRCKRSDPLITVRKWFGNLPPDRQDQVMHEIVERAERNVLSTSLQRIYVIERDSELTLEFWFQGCTQMEADLSVAAAIEDAAAVELDLPALVSSEAAK
jgi:hypothetical protein